MGEEIMGISKYSSNIKSVNHNCEVVYNYLSNFNNLGSFFNEYTLAQLSQQVPKLKITDFSCSTDEMNFKIDSYGEAGLVIVNKEPPKTIKISGKGKIPFELFLWIQILPTSPYQSKIKVTLHADLNIMMKMLIGKKIDEGIDKIADALALLPYM